jgi:hypothetical protein
MSVGEDGRAADDHLLQAREVVLGPLGVVEDGVEDRRHRQDARDPVALDGLDQRQRLELAEHDVLAADHRQEVGRAPAVDVEERDHVQDDVVLVNCSPISAYRLCRYSSRWVIATPLGKPVVPLV